MIGHILYWLCIFPIAEAIEIIYTILYRVVDDYGIATVGLSFAVTLLTLPIYMVAERWQGWSGTRRWRWRRRWGGSGRRSGGTSGS